MKKFLLVTLLGVCACSSDDSPSGPKTDEEYAKAVAQNMYETLLGDVDALHDAAVKLQAAAPSSTTRGWSATEDRPAIAAMTAAWLEARAAYERTEGALAPVFPDIDAAIDARYEDFIESGADTDLFDDQGVTGMHAIERILFANAMPSAVVTVEESLPGYVPAAWPATAEEAAEFKNKLKLGSVSLSEALNDSSATVGKLKVVSLLESLPGVGKVKARKVMEEIGIADNRRVQGLGAQQKNALLEQLGK
jgi:hypothetical protein